VPCLCVDNLTAASPSSNVPRFCVDNSPASEVDRLSGYRVAPSSAMSRAADLAFVRRAAELWDQDDPEIGYHPRLFCQLVLPYKDPGDAEIWGRRNGNRSLTIEPGRKLGRDGKPYCFGYPYGTIPRLLLTWLATEAVRTQSPELVLGETLSKFMDQLGLAPTGGVRGNITRLRDQMNRLFKARVSVEYDGDSNVDAGVQLNIATARSLWWSEDDRDPAQRSMMQSIVVLGETFFREVIEHPVPVSADALRALRGSPFRLDQYAWLTHRMSYLRRKTTVSWEQLRFQFGSQCAENRFGRAKFKDLFTRHLAHVLLVYPDANVEVSTAGVVLRPSKTHVPLKGIRQLALE
jgi:Plasmid encoded RepA protein